MEAMIEFIKKRHTISYYYYLTEFIYCYFYLYILYDEVEREIILVLFNIDENLYRLLKSKKKFKYLSKTVIHFD